jgi:hypothetical protein
MSLLNFNLSFIIFHYGAAFAPFLVLQGGHFMKCNMDCLNCIFEDCILEDTFISEKEIEIIDNLDMSPKEIERKKAQKERKKAYYEAHREQLLEKSKKYRAEHQEQIKAYREATKEIRLAKQREYSRAHAKERREYYQKNAEKIRQRAVERYHKKMLDPEEMERRRTYDREYAKSNHEKLLEYKRKWYQTNSEEIKKKQRERYQKVKDTPEHKQKAKEYRQRWYQKQKELKEGTANAMQ